MGNTINSIERFVMKSLTVPFHPISPMVPLAEAISFKVSGLFFWWLPYK